jgi:hypothetical protein
MGQTTSSILVYTDHIHSIHIQWFKDNISCAVCCVSESESLLSGFPYALLCDVMQILSNILYGPLAHCQARAPPITSSSHLFRVTR